MRIQPYTINHDFKCAHCHYHVTANSQFSGVVNRNHCPYCLWSKHLDLYRAGDRLSACKMPMMPVGLTTKRTNKKYFPQNQGELMLIHRCSGCGSLSINRIAADDNTELLYQIFETSLKEEPGLRSLLQKKGIDMLCSKKAGFVHLRLFGRTVNPGEY